MKPLKNAALALLAVSFMASCSSTRPSGSSSGTTGMSSGSSGDLSTTTTTTVTTYDTSVPGSYGLGTVYDYNAGTYDATAYGSGNQSRWSGMGTSYDPSAERTQFQYFMNGYQGPLDYVSFSNHTTAQAFLPLAAENAQRELELSRIAQQKASSAEVRAFANMMVNDHAMNNQELMGVASATGVTIPSFNFYTSGNGSNMGTSSVTTTTVTGYSTNNNVVTPAYNGDPALKDGVSIPLANDLRDISGFPPEMDTRPHSVTGTGTSTTVKNTVSTSGNGIPSNLPPSDPKIATPMANDLRDISGFPPEMDTRTPSVTGTGTATTFPNSYLSGNANSQPPRTDASMNVASGAGSTTTWSTTGSSSMTSGGSTWGSNNSASMNATMNEISALNNLSGAAFDNQYIRMMVQDHYQAIELFKSAAKSNDAQVRAYAEKTLPVLQAHYDQARRLK